MPAMPAAVRRATAACRTGVTAPEGAADALLQAVGEVAIDEEDMIIPVTAVSGARPMFLLVECWRRPRRQGLPPDLARRMARATVAGPVRCSPPARRMRPTCASR
jgi:pyrroline-5-carboxylate reductase